MQFIYRAIIIQKILSQLKKRIHFETSPQIPVLRIKVLTAEVSLEAGEQTVGRNFVRHFIQRNKRRRMLFFSYKTDKHHSKIAKNCTKLLHEQSQSTDLVIFQLTKMKFYHDENWNKNNQ